MSARHRIFAAGLALVFAAAVSTTDAVSAPPPPTPSTPLAPTLTPRLPVMPVPLKRVPTSPALNTAIASKRTFNPAALSTQLSLQGGVPLLKLRTGTQVRLEPANEPPFVGRTVIAPRLATSLTKYRTHIDVTILGRPPIAPPLIGAFVDHTSWQTPIRNQGARGTCVAHASVGALESMYKRILGQEKDLSENHAYNLFMANVGSNCMIDPGIKTYMAADILRTNPICSEAESPYVYEKTTNACAVIPAACSSAPKKYGYTLTSSFFSPEFGGTGTQIVTNTNFLEALLDAGNDVVLGVYVAGSDWSDGSPESGVIDVQKDGSGNPAPAYGGHAMLLVGYDRPNDYFVFKNSWGPSAGHAGYVHVTYEYLQTYAKYGYVVLGVTPG